MSLATGSTARQADLNGWYEIARNPISRVGVFPYTAKSMNAPDAATNPTRMYRVYRPAEELSDPETVKSFRLVPWTDEHAMLGDPEAGLGLMAAEQKGVHGTTGEQVQFDANDRTLYTNLKIFSQSLANAIDAGKKELSLGFRCVYDYVNGVFEGQPYDAIQRHIRGNHIATVTHGRMGPDVAVLDHAVFTFDAGDLIPMSAPGTKTKSTLRQRLMNQLKITDAKAFNTALDAEEDDAGEGGGAGGDMTMAEVSAMLKDLAPQVKGLVEALASMAPAPAAGDDPDMLDDPAADDGMEPVVDAAGQAVMDPATGKPKMQKKVAPAVPAAPAADAGTMAMDAAENTVRSLKTRAATMRATFALDAKALPLIAAMDADIARAETILAGLRSRAGNADLAALRKQVAKLTTAMDAAPKTTTTPDVKSLMGVIAKRDALANRVSNFVGTFDHADMTVAEVAAYAAGKFGLKPAAGQELTAVEAYMHGRTPPGGAGFAMDAAAAPKAGGAVNAYLSGAKAA